MPIHVLDHRDNIVFCDEIPKITNCHALYYLRHGINSIAFTVRQIEISKYKENLKFEGFVFGENEMILSCYFLWYSMTLVNYLKLIALIEYLTKNNMIIDQIKYDSKEKDVSDYCKKYVEEAVPVIYLWRNKIAAHFAATDPYKTDNLSNINGSLTNFISYSRPYYCAHKTKLVVGHEPSVFGDWSITESFETLSQRYWPEVKLPGFDK